jgi:AraC-like DNA-binding protein
LQRLQAVTHDLPRHRHDSAYAAIVLGGGYYEAGDAGAWFAREGVIVIHRPFESHCNKIARQGARVINLALPDDFTAPPAFEVRDFDGLVKASQTDPKAALAWLVPDRILVADTSDWAAVLGAWIRADTSISLRACARDLNLSIETLSRGFAKRFGTTPSTYRATARALAAVADIRFGTAPLITIAQEHGFADQAHMSRAVKRLTGASPSSWRRAV